VKIKNKLVILLVTVLGICLFSAFGFQIDVAGSINKDSGTADVSVVEPLRVEVDLANAALAEAKQSAVDSSTALTAAQSAADLANAALTEAQSAADLANAALVAAIAGGDPIVIAAAQSAADLANTALATAQKAADEANAAYLALIAGNEEKLLALLSLQQAKVDANAALATAQQAADLANTALAAAIVGGDPIVIAAAQSTADLANAALETAQQAVEDANAALGAAISEESKVSHIITNSNHGGSFIIGGEGNHSSIDGDMLSFTFSAEEGFDLVWLRIGNIKITATEAINLIPYFESFNKNNLTIHAQFKKDKDYVPETTVEGTSSDEELLGDKNNNGNTNKNDNTNDSGNKGNNKEKSNNGKKNK